MSAARARRDRPVRRLVLALALLPSLASCGDELETCTSHLDFAVATPGDDLEVVVVACLDDAARSTDQGDVQVDVDVRPDAAVHTPLAVLLELGGEPFGVDADERPPWLMRSVERVDGPGCSRVPLRIRRLDADPELALSGSVDATFEEWSRSTCSVEIESQSPPAG